MKAFKEKIESLNKKELKELLIYYQTMWIDFETFMRNEIGSETYNDLCTEFAKQRSMNMLRSWGMDEESVEEFGRKMEKKMKVIN